MSEEEIRKLYFEVIAEKGIHNQLGVSRGHIHNLRNDRPPTFGVMLEQLFKLKKIKIAATDGKSND